MDKSHIVEMEADADVREVMAALAAEIQKGGAKSPKGGKYVFINSHGVVEKVATLCGPNQTEQSHKDDLDVNRLLEPAMRKGLLRHVTKFVGEYDDITPQTFQDAQFIVAKGLNMYEALPSKIRAQFKGPGDFMQFVQNPENKDWLKKHGVLKGVDGKREDGTPTGYDARPVPRTEESHPPQGEPQGPSGAP